MLQKLKQSKKQEGFTIIEVLIVLAIAGLILLVVFLAVPALQRNSRNTQRKNDVQAILGGVSEYQSNNAGKIVDQLSTTEVKGPTAGPGTPAGIKLGFYTAVTAAAVDGSGANQGAITTDTVRLVKGAQCNDAVAGGTKPGSTRQYAVQYQIESSGGNKTGACTDS